MLGNSRFRTPLFFLSQGFKMVQKNHFLSPYFSQIWEIVILLIKLHRMSKPTFLNIKWPLSRGRSHVQNGTWTLQNFYHGHQRTASAQTLLDSHSKRTRPIVLPERTATDVYLPIVSTGCTVTEVMPHQLSSSVDSPPKRSMDKLRENNQK